MLRECLIKRVLAKLKKDLKWVKPSLKKELPELKRVSEEFKISLKDIQRILNNSKLTKVSNTVLKKLENTDYNRVQTYSEVEQLTEEYDRDLNSLNRVFEEGGDIEAPIILQIQGKYHLVSGNTRLMLCKIKNVTPEVLLGILD